MIDSTDTSDAKSPDKKEKLEREHCRHISGRVTALTSKQLLLNLWTWSVGFDPQFTLGLTNKERRHAARRD